ncbi:hypothetical protein V6Z11_A07G255100 [Gossypium hirsutum]
MVFSLEIHFQLRFQRSKKKPMADSQVWPYGGIGPGDVEVVRGKPLMGARSWLAAALVYSRNL